MKFKLRILFLLFISSFSLSLWASNTLLKEEVLEAQTILRLKDLYYDRIDGVIGSSTTHAVRLYQKQKGWNQTGNLSDIVGILRKEAKISLKNIKAIQINSLDKEAHYATKDNIDLLKKEMLLQIDTKIATTIASNLLSSFSALLALLLAVVAIVISLVYFIGLPTLREYLGKHIKETHNKYDFETESRISYKTYLHLSHVSYLYYRDLFYRPEHRGFRSSVAIAVWFIEGAIANADKLPEGKEKDSKLRAAKLHRAYHYASQSLSFNQGSSASNHDQLIALKIAKEMNECVNETCIKNQQWINNKETVAWVYILLGDNEEKKEGKLIIEELQKRGDISLHSLKEIESNYNQIKDLPRFSEISHFPTFKFD